MLTWVRVQDLQLGLQSRILRDYAGIVEDGSEAPWEVGKEGKKHCSGGGQEDKLGDHRVQSQPQERTSDVSAGDGYPGAPLGWAKGKELDEVDLGGARQENRTSA